MSWSGEQLRILRALGHEPMVAAPAGRGASAVIEESQAAYRIGEARTGAPASAEGAALAEALARAAGGRDLSALALDLEALRRDPASKRALWPKLRGLRRGH
jgi:hypothetical protein